jgi:hypothetical protein
MMPFGDDVFFMKLVEEVAFPRARNPHHNDEAIG